MIHSYDDLVQNGGQILTFKVDDVFYAADIKMVTDIIELPEITFIPHMPEYISGVINHGGKVVPVIDLRKRFSLGKRDYDYKTCVVVMTVQEMSVGLVVERAVDAENVRPSDIEESIRKNGFVSHIINTGSQPKLLLDYDKIIG